MQYCCNNSPTVYHLPFFVDLFGDKQRNTAFQETQEMDIIIHFNKKCFLFIHFNSNVNVFLTVSLRPMGIWCDIMMIKLW